MEVCVQKPISGMGKLWSKKIETPINGFDCAIELSTPIKIPEDQLKSFVGVSTLDSKLLRDAVGAPLVDLGYHQKDGVITNICQRISLLELASISALGTGEGAINILTTYDATTKEYAISAVLFTIDLSMTYGAIPLNNDQSIVLTLSFTADTSTINHKLTIYGREMPMRTNRALSIRKMSVSKDANVKRYDIKDSRFLVIPYTMEGKLDYITFGYSNGHTVRKSYKELVIGHLSNNDVSLSLGFLSTSIGYLSLVDDELVESAVYMEVVTKGDQDFYCYALADQMLPGIDPKNAHLTNEMLYDA